MSSHGTRNWVDIANAARELLSTAAARLAETRQHSTGAAFDDGYDAALTELLAHPHADRLRTLLLGTVDDSPTADEHRTLWEGPVGTLFSDGLGRPHGTRVRVQVVEQ